MHKGEIVNTQSTNLQKSLDCGILVIIFREFLCLSIGTRQMLNDLQPQVRTEQVFSGEYHEELKAMSLHMEIPFEFVPDFISWSYIRTQKYRNIEDWQGLCPLGNWVYRVLKEGRMDFLSNTLGKPLVRPFYFSCDYLPASDSTGYIDLKMDLDKFRDRMVQRLTTDPCARKPDRYLKQFDILRKYDLDLSYIAEADGYSPHTACQVRQRTKQMWEQFNQF